MLIHFLAPDLPREYAVHVEEAPHQGETVHFYTGPLQGSWTVTNVVTFYIDSREAPDVVKRVQLEKRGTVISPHTHEARGRIERLIAEAEDPYARG